DDHNKKKYSSECGKIPDPKFNDSCASCCSLCWRTRFIHPFTYLYTMKYAVWILFLCLSIPAQVFGQKPRKIEVKGANSLEFDSRVSGAQRLIGNVEFEH